MHKLKNNKSKVFIAIWIILLALFSISLLSFLLIDQSNFPNSQDNSTIKTNTTYNNMHEIESCFSLPSDKQQKCFDDFIKDYAITNNKDVNGLLTDLEVARSKNKTIENSCHPIAHAIGRYSLVKYINVGDSFEKCDLTCHSGCYHGVMERLFFTDKEISSSTNHLNPTDLKDKIPDICNKNNFSDPSNSIIFQCLHGVGHAILYSMAYNLEDALISCDFFKTSYEQSSCYGGVFMENVTAFDKKLRDVNPKDPLYPCNKVDKKYKRDCFTMQTSLMFEYGLSIPQIAEQCRLAKDYKSNCFVSLGRDLSNYVRTGNSKLAVEACEISSLGNQQNCIDGVVYALIDNTWDATFAFGFCNSLSDPNNKKTCYKDSLSYLGWSYNKNENKKKEECQKFAGSAIDLCYDSI